MSELSYIWYFNVVTGRKEKRRVLTKRVGDWGEGYIKVPVKLYNDSDQELLAFVPANFTQILQSLVEDSSDGT